jgi:hypothetical protein
MCPALPPRMPHPQPRRRRLRGNLGQARIPHSAPRPCFNVSRMAIQLTESGIMRPGSVVEHNGIAIVLITSRKFWAMRFVPGIRRRARTMKLRGREAIAAVTLVAALTLLPGCSRHAAAPPGTSGSGQPARSELAPPGAPMVTASAAGGSQFLSGFQWLGWPATKWPSELVTLPRPRQR